MGALSITPTPSFNPSTPVRSTSIWFLLLPPCQVFEARDEEYNVTPKDNLANALSQQSWLISGLVRHDDELYQAVDVI